MATEQQTALGVWPTDADCDRALEALNKARLGVRGPISREAMRKALKAGINTQKPLSEIDEWNYLQMGP